MFLAFSDVWRIFCGCGKTLFMRQKEPRAYDPGFLAYIRTQPCCVCGVTGQTEAAHIRIGHFAMGMKPDDARSTPLCSSCHREGPNAQHSMNESEFWSMVGKDPFAIAAALYAEYGGTGGTTAKPKKPRPKPKRKHKIARRPDAWAKGRKFGQ